MTYNEPSSSWTREEDSTFKDGAIFYYPFADENKVGLSVWCEELPAGVNSIESTRNTYYAEKIKEIGGNHYSTSEEAIKIDGRDSYKALMDITMDDIDIQTLEQPSIRANSEILICLFRYNL